MSYRHFKVLWLLAILATSVLCLSGCFNPRNTPFFKKLGADWERKNAEYTEEALKESPVLQEIDRLCTNEIALFDGFRLIRKSTTQSGNPYLSYDYTSEADLQQVKRFYLNYFTQNAWQTIKDQEGGWGPRWHAIFRKDSYKVSITYFGKGEEINYGFFCQKIVNAEGGE